MRISMRAHSAQNANNKNHLDAPRYMRFFYTIRNEKRSREITDTDDHINLCAQYLHYKLQSIPYIYGHETIDSIQVYPNTHGQRKREKKNNVSNRLNENDDTGRNV